MAKKHQMDGRHIPKDNRSQFGPRNPREQEPLAPKDVERGLDSGAKKQGKSPKQDQSATG